MVLLQENPGGCSWLPGSPCPWKIDLYWAVSPYSSFVWLSSMDVTQALFHPHTWMVEMSFPRDSTHLCASSLDLAFVQGLLERQLIHMKHEECSPDSHLSVPPWGLEHCLDICSPDPTQGPPAHTTVYSAVLHPTFSVGSRVWSCLKPFPEYFARKNHLWLKWSQLLISVGSAWAGWIVLATFI